MESLGKLYRHGGLEISETTDPSTYKVLDSSIYEAEFTSDNVGVFSQIDVWRVEPKPNDNLSRKVTDADGSVSDVETAAYCPASPDLIPGQWEDFLDHNCDAILTSKGDAFAKLVELGRESGNERLTPVNRIYHWQ